MANVTCCGSLYPPFSFGTSTDRAVTGHWVPGSSADTIGVYRPGQPSQWILSTVNQGYTGSNLIVINSFGAPTDQPVAGDWTGTGYTKIGVFRQGTWILSPDNTNYNSSTALIGNFGMPGDIGVTGDWTGTRKTQIGVYRPSNGTWYLNTGTSFSYTSATTVTVTFSVPSGGTPVTGDWAGDGKTRLGYFDGNGNWTLRMTPVSGDGSGNVTVAAGGLFNAVRVYPNPYKAGRGDTGITFDQMPVGSSIKIFTVSGRWVTTLAADGGGKATWNLTTDSGDKAASGIYLYLVTDGQGDKIHGTLTVIR